MTILEAVWTLLAGVGVYLACVNGIESYRDYQALGGKQNGRKTIAVGNLRREIVRGLIQLAWAVIGVASFVTANRTEVISPVAVVLVLTAAGMVLNSYLDRRDRLYLMRFGLQPRDGSGRFTKDE